MFSEQYGMGIEEYMLSELQSSVNINDLVGDIETTGVYEAKGNKLYMDEVEVSNLFNRHFFRCHRRRPLTKNSMHLSYHNFPINKRSCHFHDL